MKRFKLKLSGDYSAITAEKFSQVGEFVSFFIGNACVGLVRVGPGDSVIEEDTVKSTPCPDCGFDGKHHS